MKFDWNEAAVARLTTMWAEGYSASQIGEALGNTRSACIGKVHRLHLPPGGMRPKSPRAAAIRDLEASGVPRFNIADILGVTRTYVTMVLGPRPKTIRVRASRAKKAWKPTPKPVLAVVPNAGPSVKLNEPASLNLSIMDLTSLVCHYPSGDAKAKTLTYCGAPGGHMESRYCHFHYQLCYQPPQSRRSRHRAAEMALRAA